MSAFMPGSPYMFVDFLGIEGLKHLDYETALIFHGCLLVEVPKAVDSIIRNAQSHLTQGHGVDTGLMKASLTKQIVSEALTVGVIYQLQSDEAPYWVFMEDGFTTPSGEYWPGYHFFAQAVAANRGRMGKAVAKAWRDTSAVLAAKALVPRGVTKLL